MAFPLSPFSILHTSFFYPSHVVTFLMVILTYFQKILLNERRVANFMEQLSHVSTECSEKHMKEFISQEITNISQQFFILLKLRKKKTRVYSKKNDNKFWASFYNNLDFYLLSVASAKVLCIFKEMDERVSEE